MPALLTQPRRLIFDEVISLGAHVARMGMVREGGVGSTTRETTE
ncbi:MAG: hypothetical protein Q8M11_19680 [Sulfuritalea sp.]|nr:hypothetical protein [Sulfuritalea sp.]